MRELLYERFGDLGLGCRNAPRRPLIGPVILGSGYFIIDHGTPDEAIRAMFETVARYRGDRENPIPRAYEVAEERRLRPGMSSLIEKETFVI